MAASLDGQAHVAGVYIGSQVPSCDIEEGEFTFTLKSGASNAISLLDAGGFNLI